MEEPKVIVEEDLPSFALAGLTQPLVVRPPAQRAGSYPSISPSTLDVAPDSWRPPVRRTNGLPIVLAVMGACGTLAALAGVMGVHRWHERQKEDAAYTQKIADENRKFAAGTNPVMDPQPTAPAVDLTAPVIAPPLPTIDPAPKVQPKPVATQVQAQPKPAPVVVKTPLPATGTGTVKTYNAAAGRAIFVDGKQAGVAPAPLSVACGTHHIRVGEGKTKSVNVPCGGNVTVGTPDGD